MPATNSPTNTCNTSLARSSPGNKLKEHRRMEQTACDVLVVGSGAGGLSAAVTAGSHGLDVVLAEKTPQFGGASARAGGAIWIPCNPLAASQGVADSLKEARAFIRHVAGNHYNPDVVE